MTEHSTPGYRHGDPVTVAGDQLVVFAHEDQWVEVTPPGSAIHITVHQHQIQEHHA
jgi:hypothetical protein